MPDPVNPSPPAPTGSSGLTIAERVDMAVASRGEFVELGIRKGGPGGPTTLVRLSPSRAIDLAYQLAAEASPMIEAPRAAR